MWLDKSLGFYSQIQKSICLSATEKPTPSIQQLADTHFITAGVNGDGVETMADVITNHQSAIHAIGNGIENTLYRR